VAELGYWLLPEYQGHGYALEAIQAMVHHGFQGMDLHRVEAVVESDNYPSSQVLAKAGFTMEGIRRQCEWKETSFLDLQMWSRLSTDI
jgi:ribosomal-protein-alanine N-acetyltransferase